MNGVILPCAPPCLFPSTPRLYASRYPSPALYSFIFCPPNPGYSKPESWLLVRCTEGGFEDKEKTSLWQKVTKKRYGLVEMC